MGRGMRWRSLREAAKELDLRVRRRSPYPQTVAGGLGAADDLAASRPPRWSPTTTCWRSGCCTDSSAPAWRCHKR